MSLSVNARLVRFLAATAAATAVGGLLIVAGASVAAADPPAAGAAAATPKAVPIQAAPPAAPPAPKLPPNVLARVGSTDVTASDVVAFLSKLGGFPLVQQRVQIVIAEQQARKYGVILTQAELDKAVQDQKDGMVRSQMMQSTKPMTFSEIAAKQGVTEGLIREQARFQLLLKKTYSKVVEDSLPPLDNKIKVSHLLISTRATQPPADPAKPEDKDAQTKREADALAKVKQIQADITAGKVTWQDAIKQYSEDPSAKQNSGDLGWVGKDTPFVPEFLSAALSIQKVGDIAGPVKTQFGYHLIRLDAKGSAATAAEKATYKKQQMDQALNPQAIQGWFYGVVRNANVTYNPNGKVAAVVVTK